MVFCYTAAAEVGHFHLPGRFFCIACPPGTNSLGMPKSALLPKTSFPTDCCFILLESFLLRNKTLIDTFYRRKGISTPYFKIKYACFGGKRKLFHAM